MVTTPKYQNVNNSDSASFNCSARGSSIEIIWQYNGDNYTMADSNSNIEVKSENVSVVNGDVSALIVSSTLMIRSVTVGDSVSCVVRQRFDGRIDPDFNISNFMNHLPEYELIFSAAPTVLLPPTPTPPTASTGKPNTLLPCV